MRRVRRLMLHAAHLGVKFFMSVASSLLSATPPHPATLVVEGKLGLGL
jgi:hypothetical protein